MAPLYQPLSSTIIINNPDDPSEPVEIPWTPRELPSNGFIKEEFLTPISDFESRWSRFGFATIRDIDQYAQNAVATECGVSCNARRPSHLELQPANNGAFMGYTIPVPGGGLPTNFAIAMKATCSHRVLTQASNDNSLGLWFIDTLANNPPQNGITLWSSEGDAGLLTAQSDRTVAGVTTVIAEGGNEQNSGFDVTYFVIQKIGTTIHFWCLSDSNNLLYYGTTTLLITPTHIAILCRNSGTNGPGNAVLSIDWIHSYDGIWELA